MSYAVRFSRVPNSRHDAPRYSTDYRRLQQQYEYHEEVNSNPGEPFSLSHNSFKWVEIDSIREYRYMHNLTKVNMGKGRSNPSHGNNQDTYVCMYVYYAIVQNNII